MQMHWKWLRLLVCFMLACSVNVAWASHGRSLDVRWSVPNPADPLNVVIEVTFVARSSYYSSNPQVPVTTSMGVTLRDANGALVRNMTVPLNEVGHGVDAMTGSTGYEGQYRVFRGTVVHRFANAGTYRVRTGQCCRPRNLANQNADADIWADAIVDLSQAQRGGPVMAAPPIINLTAGALNTLSFPLLDPDGDAVSCRIAQAAEAGNLPTPVPQQGGRSLSLSSDGKLCTLTWDLRGVSGESFHALPMVLESTHNGKASSAAVDRYVIVTNRAFPVCTGGGQIALQPNQVLRTQFEATASSDLTFATVGAPAGATFTPPGGSTAPSPMAVDLAWTPTAADAGTSFIMQAVFRDAANVEGYCNYVVNVDTRNAAIAIVPPAEVTLGQAVTLDGSTSNVTGGEPIDITLSPDGGTPTSLSTTVKADGSWQINVPAANLPAGRVAVKAQLRNFNVVPADASFQVIPVVQPILTLDPIASIRAGEAPHLTGTSVPALDGTLEVVFTDSATKQVHVLHTPLTAGIWSLTGPSNLAAGPVTVQVSLVGMPTVQAVSSQFMVTAAATATTIPVPVDAGWALGLLFAALGMTAWRARSQGHIKRNM